MTSHMTTKPMTLSGHNTDAAYLAISELTNRISQKQL